MFGTEGRAGLEKEGGEVATVKMMGEGVAEDIQGVGNVVRVAGVMLLPGRVVTVSMPVTVGLGSVEGLVTEGMMVSS